MRRGRWLFDFRERMKKINRIAAAIGCLVAGALNCSAFKQDVPPSLVEAVGKLGVLDGVAFGLTHDNCETSAVSAQI